MHQFSSTQSASIHGFCILSLQGGASTARTKRARAGGGDYLPLPPQTEPESRIANSTSNEPCPRKGTAATALIGGEYMLLLCTTGTIGMQQIHQHASKGHHG